MFSKVNTVAYLESDVNFGISSNPDQVTVKKADYEEEEDNNYR